MNFVEIDGHQIAYRRIGKGIPVLFVHGVASYSFLWDEIMDNLQGEYDVIATDLLGCGASDKPKDTDCSIDVQSDILIKFIEKLNLKQVHLVGHDVGGGVVQLMAVKRPDQLIDLVMMNPVGYDYWPVQPITTMRLPVIRNLTSSIMHRSMLMVVIRRAVYHKDKLTKEIMDKFWEPLKSKEGKDGFVQLIRCINNRLLTAVTDKLRKLKIPTLLIRGDADAYLSRDITENLARDIPNSILVNIPDAGHFIQIDEANKLISLLRKFYLNEVITLDE